MKLIDTTKELELACKILKKQNLIAIDCEFIREKSYFPLPCLIQVGYENEAVLIDPLSEDLDFSSFAKIMKNKKILKIFHSGRQDIEIIYNLMKVIPEPVFDTQIAAQACGYGEAISYENLVKACCLIELDKTCRLTNWQLRPLTEEQLKYASGDVTHLIQCYHKINEFLEENNRKDWVKDELEDLIDITHYEINTENSWQRIRHNNHSLKFLNALKELAKWREERAMKHNISRQSIIKDDLLVNVATAFPENLEDMKQVRGMRSDISKSVLATEMIDVLDKLTKKGFDKKLKIKEKDISLSPTQQSLYEILKLVLKIKSNEYGVVTHIISSEKNLREYIKNPKTKNQITKGWRYEVFGKYVEEFSKGKLSLQYCPETHNIVIKEI